MSATLSNYQLGDLLGRGASGSVYRALNFLTGETVAIKSVSLLSLPPSSLPDIMSEIDLLKNLNHPNIVKYKGFARDKDNLWIVLEYCENGSLQTILKKFGKFPESLVAVYISQVLEGLNYLHEQGVIHRDIKGANILTEKDGSVKLADFGVSSRTAGAAGGVLGKGSEEEGLGSLRGLQRKSSAGKDNEVVGSPYWMAPEVIEQSGASTASDIWSVGCVVVELMEGRPPYGELAPMQALWRIVQDEQMRVPEGASPVVKDFLYHCFQKDPNLRVSAKKLLRHPWMQSARRTIEASPPTSIPHTREQSGANPASVKDEPKTTKVRIEVEEAAQQTMQPARPSATSVGSREKASGDMDKASLDVPAPTTGADMGTVRPKKPMTVYDEAVLKVQEWNEALNAAPRQADKTRRSPLPDLHTKKPRSPLYASFAGTTMPTRPSADSLTAQPSSGSLNALSSDEDLKDRAGPAAPSTRTFTGQAPAPAGLTGPSAADIFHRNTKTSDVLSRVQEKEGEDNWDDDFASFPRAPHASDDATTADDNNQKTLKATWSSPQHISRQPSWTGADRSARQPTSSNRAVSSAVSSSDIRGGIALTQSPSVEDYSDLGFGEDESGLESKLADMKLKTKSRKGLLHPNDLKKLRLSTKSAQSSRDPTASFDPSDAPSGQPTASAEPAIAESPARPDQQRAKSSPIVPSAASSLPTQSKPNLITGPGRIGSAGSEVARRKVSPSLTLPTSPHRSPRSPPASRQNSLRGQSEAQDQDQVDVELRKYQEDEEDWDMEFEREGVFVTKASATLQLNRQNNKSWRSAGEEELDPFAGLEEEFEMTDDLEANLLRDKKATLCAGLRLFEDAPVVGLERHFVASHGMLAILDVLESRLSRDVVVRLLRIVNHIVSSDVDMLESFCLIGGIPVVIPYTSKRHSTEVRLEASSFISHLTRSPLTLQMFISCRGLRILVELLDEDYISNRSLILSALEGIGSVFDLQSPTPRTDFARMFVREGILDPLSTALISILRDNDLQAVPLSASSAISIETSPTSAKSKASLPPVPDEPNAHRAVNVLLVFCQVAQGDQRVRDAFASRTVIIRILKACDLLSRKLLVVAVKAIKHLSTSPQLIEVLQNSNALEVLVGLLGRTMKGLHGNEICSHIFQTVFSMCRLSKSRQEEAATVGIVPLLKKVITQKSPLKQFALPILCDLANAGKASRRSLWHNGCLTLYLDLLLDPYWRVSALDAILAWMMDETARVEDELEKQASANKLVQCFVQSSGVSFEGILDPLLKLLRLSSGVTAVITTPAFFRRLAESLDKTAKAVTKLNLLRITRVVCEHHPDRQTLVERFGLASAVERLAKQGEAVLVRELAKEVIPILLFGNVNAGSQHEEGRNPGVGIGIGMPRIEVHAGNARAASMKRTASEGMVEIAGGRVDKALEPVHKPSAARVGRVEVGTTGTSASAEERPRVQDISIAHPPSSAPNASMSTSRVMKRSSTMVDNRIEVRPGRVEIGSSAQYVRPKTPAATPRPISHSRRERGEPSSSSPVPPSPRHRFRTDQSRTGDIARSSSSASGTGSGLHARKLSYANLSMGVPASAPVPTRLRGVPPSPSSADLASAAGGDRPTAGTSGAGTASTDQGRPVHKRQISRSQLRSASHHTPSAK